VRGDLTSRRRAATPPGMRTTATLPALLGAERIENRSPRTAGSATSWSSWP
jgi:hypothetical protein